MVHGVTQKRPYIFLWLALFQFLTFIAFVTWVLWENEVHHVSFKLFWLNRFPIESQRFVLVTFQHVHSILNVLEYC